MARRNKITLDKKVLSFSYQKSCISADYAFYAKASFFSLNKDLESTMSFWFKPGFMRDEKLRPKDHRIERGGPAPQTGGRTATHRPGCWWWNENWHQKIQPVQLFGSLDTGKEEEDTVKNDWFLVYSTECTEMSCKVHWKTLLSPPLREQGGRVVRR